MVNIEYEEASNHICYYPFQFGGTWELANMYKMVGKTFEKYMDESLHIDILADVCYVLEISETPANLDFLRAIAKVETIKDKDESCNVAKTDENEDAKDKCEQLQNESRSFADCVENLKDELRKSWKKLLRMFLSNE